jgi:hypothetical protein
MYHPTAMLDRIGNVIDSTQEMLSRLKTGLAAGEKLTDLKRLAADAAIATTLIETLVDSRLRDHLRQAPQPHPHRRH